jgi:hypothetical protein
MFDIPPCDCGGERRLISTRMGRSVIFPFTVNHVDGKPMVIESLNHLRQVENRYGVVFSAFNKDNYQDLSPVDRNLPRFRGDDEDVKRDRRR